jgi:hypothetical protein
MRVILAVAMVMVLLGSGCDLPTHSTDSGYAVVMDRAPVLSDPIVYRWGESIGQVVASETAATGATRLKVTFASEAAPLLTDNAVFYVWAGRLNYTALGTFGQPVEAGAVFMGFPSKSALNWFKFSTLMRSSVDIAAQRAQRLLATFDGP